MKHIMAAIDGSAPSFRALQLAAEMAKGLKAEFSVLIVRQFVVGRTGIYVVLNDDEARDIQDQADKIVLAAGAPKTNLLQEKSRDVAFKIVDVAIEKQVELIVMGASGKGGLKTFLLGSVSQEVLRKSACPVTIVH